MARAPRKAQPEISLRNLFPQATWQHCQDIRTRRCVWRPAEICAGDLFAVVESEEIDSLAGALQAQEFGAAALLVEQLLPLQLPQCIVPDVPAAYARIQQALVGDPGVQLPPIGVAGSLGKTVTTWLISSVLGEAAGSGFFSTLGRSTSSDFAPESCGTDLSRETAQWLGDCIKAGARNAVLELPATAIATRSLSGLKFSAICLTNLSRQSVGDQDSWARYRQNLARVLDYLQAGGACVVNVDDPHCRELIQQRDLPVMTVAIGRSADVTAKVIERSMAEQTFLLTAGSETVPVRTRIIGDAYLESCLLATGVGLLRGLSLVEIARGLESVEQIPGRWERIEAGQPFGIFVDAANSPEALNATLEALRGVTAGRLISVYGTAGEMSARQRARIGQALEAMSDLVVLADPWNPAANQNAIALDLLKGCENLEQIVRKPDRAAAIRWALGEAQPGDIVLIAGPENGPFPGMATGDLTRDDREVVHAWLSEHQRAMPLMSISKSNGKQR